MMLTPNRRMAIFLQHSKQKQEQHDILPLSIWLENLYSELTANYPNQYPTRLAQHEEYIIWEQIITSSELGQSLFKPAMTAHLAREAWILAVQWQLPSFKNMQETEDVRVYREWAAQYQMLCLQKRWVDSATFIEVLIESIQNQKITLPKEIILVGFEELTPQLTYFFGCMEKTGISIKTLSLVSHKNQVKRIAAADTEEELRFAALMAKKWLALDKGSSIGIVVPDLEKKRQQAVRLFEEVLPSDTFNVAAPIPLYHYPVIAAALLALNLLCEENNIEKFSQFLRSPFFGNAEGQQVYRAALDIKLREDREYDFTIKRFIQKLENILKKNPALIVVDYFDALQIFSNHQLIIKEKKSAEEWCVILCKLLEILKWPGSNTESIEVQAIQEQWQQLLMDYNNLGRILPPHHYQEALNHITYLAKETAFLPASLHRPVQILGLLEAVGIPFDYLWVIGLHREAWPLEPMPNPFIPLTLQRVKNLPRSSPTRELNMAKKFTERLSQGGKEVIFSYPTLVDGNPGFASTLLMSFPEINKESLPFSLRSTALELNGSERSESHQKEKGPIVYSNESIKGGTRLLALQALCPFRAFAEGRLGARPIASQRSRGLNSQERGEIIHEILYLFWEGIKDQRELKALGQEALAQRMTECIEVVFKAWVSRASYLLTPNYLSLEKKRTYQLIEKFIELEKSRSYFEIIAREKEEVVDLQGLKLTIRIDRIDKVEHGEEIIIDYKTGEPSLSHWFGERPREPQLPLYCITRIPKPAGIAYGIVRPDSIKFQGIAKEEVILPGIKRIEAMRSLGAEGSWEDQCNAWESGLTLLAKDFISGVADVVPIDGANTCRTCSLKSLCRIHSHVLSTT